MLTVNRATSNCQTHTLATPLGWGDLLHVAMLLREQYKLENLSSTIYHRAWMGSRDGVTEPGCSFRIDPHYYPISTMS